MTWITTPMHHGLRSATPDRRPSRRSVHRLGHAVIALRWRLLVAVDRRGITITAPPPERARLVALHVAGRVAEVLARYRYSPAPWRAIGGPDRAVEGASAAELVLACSAVERHLRPHYAALVRLAYRLDAGEVLTAEDVSAELTATRAAEPAAPPPPPRPPHSPARRRARAREDVLGRRLRARRAA